MRSPIFQANVGTRSNSRCEDWAKVQTAPAHRQSMGPPRPRLSATPLIEVRPRGIQPDAPPAMPRLQLKELHRHFPARIEGTTGGAMAVPALKEMPPPDDARTDLGPRGRMNFYEALFLPIGRHKNPMESLIPLIGPRSRVNLMIIPSVRRFASLHEIIFSSDNMVYEFSFIYRFYLEQNSIHLLANSFPAICVPIYFKITVTIFFGATE